MAFIESNMLPLGIPAPGFTLLNTVTGEDVSLTDLLSSTATVVMFLCNHCPYVVHVVPEIVRVSEEYGPKGVSFIGISSNDVENYPQDGPEEMKKFAEQVGYTFPYLYDATQKVAKAYDAACTPDFYVFDGNAKLVYRGRLDDARPKTDTPLSGRDLRAALDRTLAGEAVNETQYPSGGCGIKWIPTPVSEN